MGLAGGCGGDLVLLVLMRGRSVKGSERGDMIIERVIGNFLPLQMFEKNGASCHGGFYL